MLSWETKDCAAKVGGLGFRGFRGLGVSGFRGLGISGFRGLGV